MTSVYKGKIFNIVAYDGPEGKISCIDWLNEESIDIQAKFAALFVRLGDHGKIFNKQKFKHLTGTRLYEFKVDNYRILAFFTKGKLIILTHGFVKKSRKTPKGEIERAEKIQKLFLTRRLYGKK